MPPKRKATTKPTDSKEISTFFKPDTSKSVAGRKREASDQPAIDPNEDCPPPSKRQADITSDQQKIIEQKKLSAEAKLWAKKLGAGEIGESWMIVLSVEFKKPYFTTLSEFIQKERGGGTVYPPATDVFSWTTTCALENIKVVIVGQDPYHGPNQAHGLCFSVCVGVQPPPSLVNIFKELQNSIEGFKIPDHGYLMGWAKQGVLLLNACLTVRAKQPKSHAGKGWERLTDAVINWINIHLSGIVFLLWGADAQKKGAVINQSRHNVLKTVHPSPLSASRGFFGCNHFFKTNELLKQEGKDPIDWGWLPKSI